MQQQTNVSDCGLYAIAAAFDLCEGKNPAGAQYDEAQLREHFAKCLEIENLSAFPRRQVKLSSAVVCIE